MINVFMKRLWILVALIMFPVCLIAQQKSEYNKNGDEAMKRFDYSDARMWYEEGVVQCDSYSIDQLTTIWLNNKQMRASMRSLMNKCLLCLNVRANDEDTTAISKLIIYYKEGIGASANGEMTSFWENSLDNIRKQAEESISSPLRGQKQDIPDEPMKFFVGYAFSPEAPYGLTVGGVKNRLGWFARFRTNLSFNDYTGECRGRGQLATLPGNSAVRFTDNKKVNSYAGTAGLVVKCTPWLYTSIGLGYGKRDLLCEYTTTDFTDSKNQKTYWSKNIDYSYNGLAADLDVMLKLGPIFVSAGCNTINFKYIDLNAGIGVFF